MNSENDKAGTVAVDKTWWTVLMLMVLLGVGYIFSPPALIIMLDTLPGARALESAVEVFLAPLKWMYKNNALVKAFYDWLFQLMGTV